jgi:hypothetical protein
MEQAVREVTTLLLALAIGVSPIGVLLAVLNRRDRREAGLLALVSDQFSGQALRSEVAIAIRCAYLGGRDRVTVDMRACSPEAIWDALARLGQALPAHVEVRVVSRLDREPARSLATRGVSGARRIAAFEVRATA